MKKLLLLLVLFSCQEKQTHKEELKDLELSLRAKSHVDSVIKNAQVNSMFADTVGLANSPVKVLKARPVKKEYSNYKDISLTYTNVSGKTISAIRFKWYGINSFGEPADMGALAAGFGSGFSDTRLRAGKTETSEWSVLSRDLKKVNKAWAYEVVFEDGTKWKSASE